MNPYPGTPKNASPVVKLSFLVWPLELGFGTRNPRFVRSALFVDESRSVLQKWEEEVEVGKILHPMQSHAETTPFSSCSPPPPLPTIRTSAERSAHATAGTHSRHSAAGQRAQELSAPPPLARRRRQGPTGRRLEQCAWRRRRAESPSPNDSGCTCRHRTWCRRCPQ